VQLPKNKSKLLSTRQPSSRKFIIAADFFFFFQHFCDQKIIMMEDEIFFTFSHSTLTGINGFFTDDVENTPAAVNPGVR
jgi:hypothetical protein